MDNKKIGKNIIFLGLGTLVNYAISFFLTSYITDNIGIDAYGFVSIAKTFVNYAEIITIALTTFIVRYISLNYHKKKYEEANTYFSSSVYASIFLAGLIMIAAVLISWKLEYILNIPEDLIKPVKILFILVFVNYSLATIVIPFSSSLLIKNRLDISGIIKIISYVVQAILMILLFSIFAPTVWFVGIGLIGTSLITLLGNYYFSKKLTPELKCSKKLFSIKKIKTLIGNGVWSAINQLGNTLNSGLDLIISNLMLTSIETGEIAVAKTIGSMVGAFEAIIYQSVQPQLIESYAKGNSKDFMQVLCKLMKICGFFSAIIVAGFSALGKLYFKLWLPNQNDIVLYWLTVITLINHITDGLLRPVYYVSILTVKNKIPCIITILGGILNVAGMFVLLKFTGLGVYSVVITTAVIMLLINIVFNPRYASWCLKTSSKKIYYTMFKHLIATIIMITVFNLIALIISPTKWISLFFSAALMIILGIPIYVLLTCDKTELVSIWKYFKRKMPNYEVHK